jgi:phosphatidylinositol glycan class A protein
MVNAKMMGLKTIFTEHSLYQFNDAAGINLNKTATFFLTEVDASIAVSHICKENIFLRLRLDPNNCFVIPNAVDSQKFYPKTI